MKEDMGKEDMGKEDRAGRFECLKGHPERPVVFLKRIREEPFPLCVVACVKSFGSGFHGVLALAGIADDHQLIPQGQETVL